MTDSEHVVRKGDRYVWQPLGAPAEDRVSVIVTRVARDRTWADIKCFTIYALWAKRQRLPLPAEFRRVSP